MSDDNPWKPVVDAIDADRADAARWRYVREHLAFLVAHYRNKASLWSVRDPGDMPGLTFEETIDRLIAERQSKV